MARPRGPRGETVTVVTWCENGVPQAEVYAAKGGKGSRATHMTANDRLAELSQAGVGTVAMITVSVK